MSQTFDPSDGPWTPPPTREVLEEIAEYVVRGASPKAHGPGCWKKHPECMMVILFKRLNNLRAALEAIGGDWRDRDADHGDVCTNWDGDQYDDPYATLCDKCIARKALRDIGET